MYVWDVYMHISREWLKCKGSISQNVILVMSLILPLAFAFVIRTIGILSAVILTHRDTSTSE